MYQRWFGPSVLCGLLLLPLVYLPLLTLSIAWDRKSLAVSIGMENEIPAANLTVMAFMPITWPS